MEKSRNTCPCCKVHIICSTFKGLRWAFSGSPTWGIWVRQFSPSIGTPCLPTSRYLFSFRKLHSLNFSEINFCLFLSSLSRVTVTCGVGRFKGEKGRRTRRAKENGGNAQDWRREGGRGRREVSGMLRRERRIQRREAMRRRRFSCSQLTHTFTRPHQQNWPEVPVWEHWWHMLRQNQILLSLSFSRFVKFRWKSMSSLFNICLTGKPMISLGDYLKGGYRFFFILS